MGMLKWHDDGMNGWTDDRMTWWWDDGMTRWRDDWITRWLDDWMTRWPDNQMIGWQEASQTMDWPYDIFLDHGMWRIIAWGCALCSVCGDQGYNEPIPHWLQLWWWVALLLIAPFTPHLITVCRRRTCHNQVTTPNNQTNRSLTFKGLCNNEVICFTRW